MQSIVSNLMTGFQLFINFATICTLLYTLTKFMSKPADTMKERIEALEEWKDDIEQRVKQREEEINRRLKTGSDHFDSIDEGNAVTQQALLAIMDSTINGDNKEELKKARQRLYDYLSKRREH